MSSAELLITLTGSVVAVPESSVPELSPVLSTAEGKQNWLKGFPSCFCNSKVSLAAHAVSCSSFPRWPFLWITSLRFGSLPRILSAHWLQKGRCIYYTSSVPSLNRRGIIYKYFLAKIFQHCYGAVGRSPLKA